MTDEPTAETRKRRRVGAISERGAVNAVRTLFEAHGLVVDETDGRSDYGRDLIVDITAGDAITGGVIGVQVKGDKRFIREGDWVLPASGKDLTYWSESTVPIVAVLWDPRSGELRWANLTSHARADDRRAEWPTRGAHEPLDRSSVKFPASRRLDATTISEMVLDTTTYLQQSSSRTLLGLFGHDPEQQASAVADCWALGRNDGRAFTLLRHALPFLSGRPLIEAIVTLSHLTPHPDILWNSRNWVPQQVEEDVARTFRWSPQEIVHLVDEVERWDEDDDGWRRGGIGQCLYHLLREDDDLPAKTGRAIDVAVETGALDSAVRLLVLHQYCADDPVAALHEAVDRHEALQESQDVRYLVAEVDHSGWVAVY